METPCISRNWATIGVLISIILIVGCLEDETITTPGTTDEVSCPQELIGREYTHDSGYGAYILKGFHQANGNVPPCTSDGNHLYCETFVYNGVSVDIVLNSKDQEVIPTKPNFSEPQTFIVEDIYCEEYIKPTITATTTNQCPPGECYSNGFCCPNTAPYYCEGRCYDSQSSAMSASQGKCSSHKVIC